jgi:hypothetical protein
VGEVGGGLMTNFSELIAYFENLAKTHVEIQHTDNEKHFFRFELDEVLNGIQRTDVAYPMLILEGYSYDYTDNKSDNIIKNRSGAFIVLDHCPDISDYTKVHEIWDNLETIADDILIKMKSDKRNPLTPVVRGFEYSGIESKLIANEIGNSIGIRITFTISSPVSSDVNTNRWINILPGFGSASL